MSRRTAVMGAALAAVMAAGAAHGVASWKRSDHDERPRAAAALTGGASDGADTHAVVAAEAGGDGADVDLSGTWRFDPSVSDRPGPRGRGDVRGTRPDGPRVGGGPRDGIGGGERRGGPEREGGGREGGRGRFRGRMPSLMEIHQDPGAVMLADSTGAPFVEIRTDGTAPETAPAPSEDGPRVVAGNWNGAALEVNRIGPAGATVMQRFTLEDDGRTLVIHHRMPAGGERPAREFKRVYRRVAGS